MSNVKTITVEQAQAEGVSPQQLREVANWNSWQSSKVKGRATRIRLSMQAEELRTTAKRLQADNDNRRRT